MTGPKSGRRDLMGSQRVAGQVWKEAWKPQVGRRELLNTKASPMEQKETAANPLPPIQCATHPIGHPQGGLLSITSQTPEMHPRPFFGGFWHPQWSFARVFPHPQGNPQASAHALADMWIKMAAFPDLALRRCCLEIARACDYSSWFKFSSSQSPLETYKLRNMMHFRVILCWRYLSSANVCNFIHDRRGVSDSIEISWLRYHVKTRARRGSSFSQLGLEPNHTGWTAQSLFFLEESCRVKCSDTQTFSNFSNYFKRVLKL